MKKYLYLTLFMIIGMIKPAYCLYSLDTRTACCPKNTSEQECCENEGGEWCNDKKICLEYASMCEAICSRQPAATNCICAGVTIDVTPQNSSAQMTYCCDPSDKSKRDCCLAMGYTWVGPNKNTGACTAPQPDICLDMLVGDEPEIPYS